MKWTTEELDKAGDALRDEWLSGGLDNDSFRKWITDTAIDLACQRNALLEACKRILPQSLTGNPTLDIQREYWEYEKTQGRGEAEDVLFALAAISKAEGK